MGSRRGWWLALLASFWLAVPTAVPAEEEAAAPAPPVELPDTWYAQALAYADVGINVTHFWSKGPLLRAETVVAGRRIVTIVNGDTYFAYDGLGRSGLAIGRSPAAIRQDAERTRPFGNEMDSLLRLGAESVGRETLGGSEVEIFRITDRFGRRQVWVSLGESRLPLQLEIFRRGSGSTSTTRYLNWQRGIPISDAFFQPDAGVNLSRLGFDEYVAMQADRRSVGPVPVLYTDLLHGY